MNTMHALLKQLYRWRTRERVVRLVWGGARWLAVAAVALAVACLTDWVYDRYADVPMAVRVGLVAVQAAVAAVAAYYFVVRPLARTPRIDDLASRAEQAIPAFDHRLVTAIQLNRPSARTAGMSPALIAAVTAEATDLARQHRLTRLVDYRRVGWALAVIAPVALLWGGFAALRPALATALLKRQALLDAEIPRSVALVNTTAALWPSGDEVEIRYEVTGRFREGAVGTVYVTPDGQPAERYPLTFQSVVAENTAAFTARVPPSSVNFTFRARLADGRTRADGTVGFEPRPAVQDVEATSVLPDYLGLVPSGPHQGERYEKLQPRGDVVGLPGSAVRVGATFQKPARSATLVLLERGPGTTEKVSARRPMTLRDGRTGADDRFDLRPEFIGYKVEVEDDNGFRNLAPPRRDLRTKPHIPPVTAVLKEILVDPASVKGPLDDYEVEGMPVLPDGRVMLGYKASSDFGIRDVSVWYRINDETAVWSVPLWHKLPLKRTVDPGTVGRFREDLGVFEKSGATGTVEFYPVPSPNPETEPGEFRAGGRYNFEVAGLRKKDGSRLGPDDRIYFWVVATDKHPDAGHNEPVSREGERVFQLEKVVKTPRELLAWIEEKAQSRDRLRNLEQQQKGVFNPTKPDR